MKKIYLTLGLGALILGANAQQKVSKSVTAYTVENSHKAIGNLKTAAINTLMPTSMTTGCASVSLTYYSIANYTATPTYTLDSRGFLFGTNVLYQTQTTTLSPVTFTIVSDIAAQKYSVTGGTITVNNILVKAGKFKTTGATVVNAKIFNENSATKAPNMQVGGTASKALSTFTTGTAYNVFTFTTPVSLTSGNFFAAIESPTIGGISKDTLGILSSAFGCSSTDSLSWEHYTVTAGAGTSAYWSSVKSDYGNNLDICIFPVVDIVSTATVTGIQSVSKGDLTLLAAYPNPATSEVSINFGINQSGNVEIEIYDITGKFINTIKLGRLESGNHSESISVSNLNSGVYMYGIKTETTQIFSKFTVSK